MGYDSPENDNAAAVEASLPVIDLTVVVVSDYEAGAKSWHDELEMIAHLAAQENVRPFKVLIGESENNRDAQAPDALFATPLNVEIVYGPREDSASLKDYAVAQVETEWVAVFEADAVPEPGWMAAITEAAASKTDYSVFGGRTYYGEDSSWHRALNLLDRSFDDRGQNGPCGHISNNAALYKTDMLKRHPYPKAATPFASARLRNKAIFDEGHRAYMVRDAKTRHAIGDLSFVWDVHRNTGFSDVAERSSFHALQIPLILASRVRNDIKKAAALGSDYLKIQDWPLWMALLAFVRVPQTRGMIEALRKSSELSGSAYR
ncbi:MAG: glycosyltransferase [Pseudomonadota bacterium]